MMATSSLSCSVCDLRHVSKPSAVWCTECDEGLCDSCQEHHSLSKASRNHTVIPITDYHKLPSDVVKISQFCDKHNEKLSIYCKMHECPCCRNCIVESHNKCHEILKIEDVINNVKSSNAFFEIEQTLKEVGENIEKIREDRQNNLKTLPETRKQIEKEILETRTSINNHIDKIQADIIKELYATADQESKQIHQLLNSLEEKQQGIAILQGSISDIKQHASDLQTFLSMKRIEKEVFDKNEFIRSISSSDHLKQIVLSLNINTAIKNLITDIPNFGKIIVESIPSNIELTTRKQKQAQLMVAKVPSRSFENISLNFQQTINTKESKPNRGTYLLPDGRMVFSSSSYRNSSVTVLNANGSVNFNVKLPSSSSSFDVAYITEINSLAVSTGGSGAPCIYIIDMQTQNVKKTISLNGNIYGITYNGTDLIYSGRLEGIRTINPHNETISDIVAGQMEAECYVTTFSDKLYHTNPGKNTVTCFNLQGKLQWTFQNESVLKTPGGITVDSSGDIYVVGRKSNNVILISSDGKQHRQLLSGSDGLSEPRAIHFSQERNLLIVAKSSGGEAFLYSVN
ncbi:tripartite motif-containing protein 2-like [Mytilus edulis]|uniref:tripartite motif-containing protein 2-like n=1 Tax=Mytilus edulis TaxID=6550 RepID=UPI0039EF5AD7